VVVCAPENRQIEETPLAGVGMSETPAGATPYDAYLPGAKDPFGRTIKAVVGRHRLFIVYVTDQNEVGWCYDQMPDRLRPAVQEFQSLVGLARACLTQKLRVSASDLLAVALYGALLCPEGDDPKSHFAKVRAFIRRRSVERARLHYVMYSLVLALAIGALALVVFRKSALGESAVIALGVSGGVTGAAVSIIQRGWKLQVDPFDSVWRVAAQGFVRVCLGGMFGSILVVLSLADLAFGSFANNHWAMFGLSTAAGLSERLVPDLLEQSAKVGIRGDAIRDEAEDQVREVEPPTKKNGIIDGTTGQGRPSPI
jgi:hypothetical protein